MAEVNPPAWINGTTVPDSVLRRMTTAIMGPGVARVGDLLVTEHTGTPNMSVDVAAGAAFVAGTSGAYQGSYFVENQASVVKTIAAAHATNARKDIVVARVRDHNVDSSGVRAWDIFVVTGTPSGSPVAPATPANSMLLATVDVPAASTSVINARITDARTLARPWTGAWGVVAFASVTANQTGFASSAADVPGATVTFTAVAGRRYRTTLLLPIMDSASAGTLAGFVTDAANTIKAQNNAGIAAGGSSNFQLMAIETGLSGSVTRKGRAISTGGSATISGSATSPISIMVEDVGPA